MKRGAENYKKYILWFIIGLVVGVVITLFYLKYTDKLNLAPRGNTDSFLGCVEICLDSDARCKPIFSQSQCDALHTECLSGCLAEVYERT